MTDQQDPRHEQYERVRDAFEDLKIEDKTAFLIKETVNTILQGVNEFVHTVAREFDAMFEEAPVTAPEAEEAPAAEEPPPKKTTSRKTSTASKGRSTARKTGTGKTTAGKTTTRKTTTRKSTTAKKTTPPKKDNNDDA